MVGFFGFGGGGLSVGVGFGNAAGFRWHPMSAIPVMAEAGFGGGEPRREQYQTSRSLTEARFGNGATIIGRVISSGATIGIARRRIWINCDRPRWCAARAWLPTTDHLDSATVGIVLRPRSDLGRRSFFGRKIEQVHHRLYAEPFVQQQEAARSR